MLDHNVKPGPLEHCQICGSTNLEEIINLGQQPLCAALPKTPLASEKIYPLGLNQCRECSLSQLSYVVPGEEVYPPDYPYLAGVSWPIIAAHRKMAVSLVENYGKGFCVDIGCNDGTLLKQFKELGCDVIGFEPTNVAQIARQAGIPVVQDFFRPDLIDNYAGRARIVTMTNVFAHMADLGTVMQGVCSLLSKSGVLIIENHYLLDILEQNQFDSIYHEHIRTYTLRSLMRLFEQYGLEIFHVERVSRYAGNIRVHVTWRGLRTVQSSVGALLEVENVSITPQEIVNFRERVNRARDDFRMFTHVYRNEGIVGCSAPGRASTLLNYFGVSKTDIPWTGEVTGSLKIGKYIPGCMIPIVSNKRIVEEQPTHIVLLAWHYANEIIDRLRKEKVTSRLYVPLPRFRPVGV